MTNEQIVAGVTSTFKVVGHVIKNLGDRTSTAESRIGTLESKYAWLIEEFKKTLVTCNKLADVVASLQKDKNQLVGVTDQALSTVIKLCDAVANQNEKIDELRDAFNEHDAAIGEIEEDLYDEEEESPEEDDDDEDDDRFTPSGEAAYNPAGVDRLLTAVKNYRGEDKSVDVSVRIEALGHPDLIAKLAENGDDLVDYLTDRCHSYLADIGFEVSGKSVEVLNA